MTQLAEKYYSPTEYLALEEKASAKSEYFRGQLYQMAGGSARHNQICSNVNAALNLALFDQPCITYTSDMRILVKDNGLYTYADGSVVCGEAEFAEKRDDTITNPLILVEVLSKSTRNYDRADKFELYREITSLQVYLIVDQLRVYVEYHHKLEDGSWKLETFTDPSQNIEIAPLNIEISVARLYHKVSLPTKTPKTLRESPAPHPTPED